MVEEKVVAKSLGYELTTTQVDEVSIFAVRRDENIRTHNFDRYTKIGWDIETGQAVVLEAFMGVVDPEEYARLLNYRSQVLKAVNHFNEKVKELRAVCREEHSAKIGDKLEIISCAWYSHSYPIGAIVTVVEYYDNDSYTVTGVSSKGIPVIQIVNGADVKPVKPYRVKEITNERS